MMTPFIRSKGRLVALTLALLTLLTFGLTLKPMGHMGAASAVTLASSSITGTPDTASDPPVA